MTSGPRDGIMDYYGMFEANSHLQRINEAGFVARTTYFANMSRAVAMTCLGNVYIMSDEPDHLENGKSSGGIWWCTEWPKLVQRFQNTPEELAPYLIAVDTADYRRAYYVDWVDAVSLGPALIPRADLEMLRRAQEERQAQTGDSIQKRDSCSIPQQYEPEGEDFFG